MLETTPYTYFIYIITSQEELIKATFLRPFLLIWFNFNPNMDK